MALDFFESLFDVDGDGEITAADDFFDFMLFKETTKSDDEDDLSIWDESEDGSL